MHQTLERHMIGSHNLSVIRRILIAHIRQFIVAAVPD